jgi:hypothetical protein
MTSPFNIFRGWHVSCTLIAASASFFVFASGCSSSGQRSSKLGTDALRVGEYLREDYIKALCTTLSPMKATRPDDFPQLVAVTRDQSGLSFMPIHNFHEGDEPYHLTGSGLLKQTTGALPQDLGQLTAHTAEAFSLRKGANTFRFRLVENAERWVSNAAIAGSYRDESGAKYVLDRSGKAIFPGQEPFSYTLGLDHVLTDHDYVFSSDLKKSWAAIITAQRLVLHDESGDKGEIVTPTPRWMLTRVSVPACSQP